MWVLYHQDKKNCLLKERRTNMRTKGELETLQAKLKEVMADKTFAERLASLEESEDVKKALE